MGAAQIEMALRPSGPSSDDAAAWASTGRVPTGGWQEGWRHDRAIVRFLDRQHDAATTQDIAEHLRVTGRTARRRLEGLLADRKVVCVGRLERGTKLWVSA